MRRSLLLASFAALAIAAAPANAQVVRGDQIVAQSNFVNRSQAAIPQVSIIVRADFVLFSVTYETATRSADAREAELEKTFKTITDRAAKAEGVNIEVGSPGNSAAIETAAIKELIADARAAEVACGQVLGVRGDRRGRGLMAAASAAAAARPGEAR